MLWLMLAEGEELGDLDGLPLAEGEVLGLGLAEGLLLGLLLADGLALGLAEGEADALGLAEGEELGLSEGLLLGLSLAEGLAEGDLLGDTLAEGLAEGDLLGDLLALGDTLELGDTLAEGLADGEALGLGAVMEVDLHFLDLRASWRLDTGYPVTELVAVSVPASKYLFSQMSLPLIILYLQSLTVYSPLVKLKSRPITINRGPASRPNLSLVTVTRSPISR